MKPAKEKEHEDMVAIKKEDLDSLIYRTGELENIIQGISKSIPKLDVDNAVKKEDKVLVKRVK